MHSRDIALERAAREADPAPAHVGYAGVEAWWRARSGLADPDQPPPGPWPTVSVADTRGILRREPITPPLARDPRDAGARRRVFLVVSQTHLLARLRRVRDGRPLRRVRDRARVFARRRPARLSALRRGAPAPGHVLRVPGPAAVALQVGAPSGSSTRCAAALADAHRALEPTPRGARGEAQRAAAAGADVVIGTRGALRLFGPASLGLAGFVAPDQLLRTPDFRAGEHTLGLVWAAAERILPDGSLIIQSQNPGHYAFAAVARQNLDEFSARRAQIPRRAPDAAVQAPRHRRRAGIRRHRGPPAGRHGRRRAARARGGSRSIRPRRGRASAPSGSS